MKKNLWQTALLLTLAVVYVIFFTDWFRPKPLLIHYTTRQTGAAMRKRINLPPTVTFGFQQGYRLKEIRVISLADLATNRDPIPLWHLVSDSNSVPYDAFHYGQQLRGMHPAVPGAHAEPLASNQVYRLYVQTDHVKGQHDFSLTPQANEPEPTEAK